MADFSVSSVSTLQTQLAILCKQLQIQNSYFNNKLDNVENRLYQAESKIPVNGKINEGDEPLQNLDYEECLSCQ